MSDLLHQFLAGYHQAVRTLRKEVLDASPSQWRLAADTVARLYIQPRDLIVDHHVRDGIPGQRVRRSSTPTNAPDIIWIHGGGFVFWLTAHAPRGGGRPVQSHRPTGLAPRLPTRTGTPLSPSIGHLVHPATRRPTGHHWRLGRRQPRLVLGLAPRSGRQAHPAFPLAGPQGGQSHRP